MLKLNREVLPKRVFKEKMSKLEEMVSKIIDGIIEEGSSLLEEYGEKEGKLDYTNFISSVQGDAFNKLRKKIYEGHNELLVNAKKEGIEKISISKEDFMLFFLNVLLKRAEGTPYEAIVNDFVLKWGSIDQHPSKNHLDPDADDQPVEDPASWNLLDN